MKKGVIYKTIISIIVSALCIMPFSISIKADNIINNSYIIGLKTDVYDYESNTWKYTVGSDIDFKVDINGYEYNFLGYDANGNIKYQMPTGMNICNAGSGCKLILKTENLDITEYHNSTYYYKHIVVFNNHYEGTFKINGTLCAVNGITYEWINTDGSNTGYTFSDFNLSPVFDKNWQFPIESLSGVYQAVRNNNELVDYDYILSNYHYPVFKTNTNKYLVNLMAGARSIETNSGIVFIFACNLGISNLNTFMNNFTFNENFTCDFSVVDFGSSQNFRIFKLMFYNTASNNQYLNIKPLYNNYFFMPIYLGYIRNGKVDNMSMDFALNFGLNNSVIDDLNKLANGDNGSNQSVNNANSINNNLGSSGDQLEGLESQYNNDMSSNLQSINTNLNVNNVSQFVNASNWVKARFDYIANKEAFQLLITYGLITGLGLLLLGRYLRG